MSLSRFETDQNPALLPEKETEVSFVPVPELEFSALANKTKGNFIENKIVVWSPENGVANGKLVRKVRGTLEETRKVEYYMNSETYKDEVSDYVVVLKEDSVAFIDATDPSTNTILGFEVKDGSVNTIMGNEINFPQSYIEARNMAHKRRLDSFRKNN